MDTPNVMDVVFGTGMTDVTDVMGVMDVTDVMGVTGMTGVMDVTDVKDAAADESDIQTGQHTALYAYRIKKVPMKSDCRWYPHVSSVASSIRNGRGHGHDQGPPRRPGDPAPSGTVHGPPSPLHTAIYGPPQTATHGPPGPQTAIHGHNTGTSRSCGHGIEPCATVHGKPVQVTGRT